MRIIEHRKVFHLSGSLVITLPAWWVKVNGLKKGVFVKVVGQEQKLLIKPYKQKHRKEGVKDEFAQ